MINRIVPTGTGLQEALQLAKEIAEFPQACLNKDRYSAIHSAGVELEQCMKQEFDAGTDDTVIKEAIKHSKSFDLLTKKRFKIQKDDTIIIINYNKGYKND